MARYKNGINGPFSGKVGAVVGASWRGIDYMRSVQKAITKPASQAQLSQRLKFKLVTGWLTPLRDLIWIGYQFYTGSQTPVNGCVGYHLKEAIKGEAPDYRIDFPKAVFSRGELMISLIKELLVAGGMLHIEWDNVQESLFCRADDKATFIVYNPAKEKFVRFQNAAERGAKEVSLQMPVNFAGDAIHCYMQYVNAGGNAVSTSLYLGQMTIA